MSKTAQISIGVIVAIIVVAGAAWWWSASQNSAPVPSAVAPNTAPTAATPTAPSGQSGAPAAANTPAPGTTLTSGDSNSNTSLNSDLAQIDGQMNGMSGDNASINQGLSDQPVTQAQL